MPNSDELHTILLVIFGTVKTITLIPQQSNARFYKPWKAADNFTVLYSKKQIAELSEATVLSQKAVYADVLRAIPFRNISLTCSRCSGSSTQ